jgi:H+/Cl- antiporter ClcA
MNDEGLKPRAFLKLLLLAALMGLMSAVITFAFIWVVHELQGLLWDHVSGLGGTWTFVLTVVVCAIGGLVVGVLVKVFGDHTGVFAELMANFGRTGRFSYREAPGMVITALVSLVAGGSLGPEAPLADACGGLGTLLSDRLKQDEKTTRSLGFSGISGMLGSFITSPFSGAILAVESARGSVSYVWALFPSLVASAVATVVFVLLSGSFFGNLVVFPDFTPHLTDLVLAVPLGLIGAAAGAVFIVVFARLRKIMEPLRKHVILRGLIGGLGMGIAGALLPLTLFSGEYETLEVIDTAAEIGVVMLIVLAVVKLFVTSLLLATGWKGGYIFPTMFAGVALGMALHLIFPSIPVAVAVAATMSGAMVATMKAPLFTALFVAILVQREAYPVIAIAVIVGLLATMKLSMTPRPAADAGQTEGEEQEQIYPGPE